ncbi:Hypp7231 [Branchiostoma lanceolatum]|uniref:Hypp7231 protein n=1 Tax=Branchiostoma lanceolatum TaxID=7740 RepID=A0A8K0E8T5_BRALA|nr:Hypp7231 [Branchiostoma lanceolatum]
MTESNSGPTGEGIFLSVPLVATLCVFLGLFIICTIALGVRYRYKMRQRDPNSLPGSRADSNPTGTSSGSNDIRQAADINSQSERSHLGTEDSEHIYNVPTDDVDPEYSTIPEINQSEGPHPGTGKMQSLDSFGHLVLPPPLPTQNQTGPQVLSPSGPQPASGQMQHLGSFNNGYEVPSLSLCPENGAHPQARGGKRSHTYENSQMIAAAAKDAAADPQVNVYDNNDEPVDNQSQTAAAPGADSPNHYEPLRNPSSQQQHTYTSLLPHDSQHH